MPDPVLEDFLRRIASWRSRISRIVLFGSRARGDFQPDSDYDLLVVVDRRDEALTEGLYDAVIDTLCEHGRLLSLKIFPQAEFERLATLPSPFMRRVLAEGQPVG